MSKISVRQLPSLFNWKKIETKHLIVLIVIGLTISFIYGWYYDSSVPQSGAGWADQGVYLSSSRKLKNGELPSQNDLHFPIGYPLLGALASYMNESDPFVLVSYTLLLLSTVFCFTAASRLMGKRWALVFITALFVWDGSTRDFHFASELFNIPWNNQVLFFLFAFYFWLSVDKFSKKPSARLVALSSFLSGLTIITREEAVLFAAPMMAAFLILARAEWHKWLLAGLIVLAVLLPQVIIKQQVIGSFIKSTHDDSYSTTLSDKYFRADKLYANTAEVIVNSDAFSGEATNRKALLQKAPWLWLAPLGILIILIGRYPQGLKLFTLISLGLMLFYLSGSNMSARKLDFHCLRYISPSFIILNLSLVVAVRHIISTIRRNKRRIIFMGKKAKILLKKMAMITPFTVPLFTTLSSVLIVALLLMGELRTIIVLPLLFAILVFSIAYTSSLLDNTSPKSSSAEQVWVSVAAILIAALWGLINAQYSSQHVYVNRDPGIYAVAAAELVDSKDLRLDQPQIFNNVKGVADHSFGFGADVDNTQSLFAQGAHLLPAILGLVGRIAGEVRIFNFNPIIGALSLITFFGFARTIIRPKLALLSMLALSLSLPMIYFSRDTYTEPLSLLFSFGGLTLLWLAIKSNRKLLWLVSGMSFAASALARIDGYISIAAIIAFVAIYIIADSKNNSKGKDYIRNFSWLLSGAIGVGFLGWLDLTVLSSGYYGDLRKHFLLTMVLNGLAISLLFIAILFYKTNYKKHWFIQKIVDYKTNILVIGVSIICIFLVSRPLWWTAYGESRHLLTEGIQNSIGHPIDGRRSYAEITFNMAAWYIGPLLAIAGMIGYVLATYHLSRSVKQFRLLGPAFILTFLTMVLYFMRPSIVPDQIWASRRMLPVVFPGIILFGVYALDSFIKRQFIAKKQYITGFLISTAVLLPIFFISWPFLKTRTETPLYDQVRQTCATLPESAVILLVGRLSQIGVQSFEAFCDVPVLALRNTSQDNLGVLYEEASGQSYTPVIGILASQKDDFLPKNSKMTTVSSVDYIRYGHSLDKPPRSITTHNSTLLFGRVAPDGSIKPLDN